MVSGKGTLKTTQYSKYRPLQAGWWWGLHCTGGG